MSWLEKRPKRPLTTREEFTGLPNYITYFRIFSVGILVLLIMLIQPERETLRFNILVSWISMIIFVIAQTTDGVDGFVARKYNLTSTFGKFIDPLADKLLSLAVLVMLIPLARVEAWIVVVLISREMCITALRGIAASEGIVMSASQYGKQKTFLQSFAIGFLLVHYPFLGIDPQLVGTILIWMTALLSLGSGVHYTWVTFKVIFAKKRKKR
ncbi:MAG: CDP-diacylglycerol--glycerol-3-phosphate 3-phosphatidyltransferase [Deltaproteobacteria bacterium RIFCSPLOWO2_02_FULL_50_16]|nr:MAG: CDP-diacylglycerol--glycerol-3-phosphate 3-phosphatidyltransferase [Deltaproteobacteria bacterium GWA2_50_8]OGQ25652.1 MAG: CDP-diacylglycerol--glycerol-3-phosphate 3-phosphatidyltransferase [Deltaproteobacteria bacterium RIFCSPHIGHO2_02_FULL_50_15]OGQ56573.1 MAG: CDP-diacylglycerol--glycerol-3-phosphate 3-phosphatidyltransferase [Deltaproteobacteria bacterium RIFCSPLOWO2_02_FULL_50_16]OGQ65562.1 MAG: CDP-diacylglycerol--glycerol-3-phosphate 3-phosphatidyltransferase [Deltaproteobacteria